MVSLLSLLTVLLTASFSDAAPFVHEKRGIPEDQFNTLKLMAQYAAAAYCPTNIDTPGDQLRCDANSCQLVEAAHANTTTEFNRENTPTDVTGFVAIDNTNKLIVVSFRGSAHTMNSWMTDLDYRLTDTDICSGCKAHRGLWESWGDARGYVMPAVKQASAKFPNYKIAVTGHSLGGGIASLAAATLRNSGMTVALYSYGSPRVGGPAISSHITNQPGGNFRVTHKNDPVPKLPLLFMGFVHISPEYYINTGTREEVKPGDISVYTDDSNKSVGNQASLLPIIGAHRFYFSSMRCSTKSKRNVLGALGMEGVDVHSWF